MAGEVSLKFRSYTAADKNACVAAFKSNIPQYFLREELDQYNEWLDAHAAQGVEHPNVRNIGHYFVVLLDDVIVGCGGFAFDDKIMESRMTWGLVENKLHRKGIGKQFLLWRIEQMRTLHPEYSIALDTTQHSAPFFERMGFETVKITNDSYGKNMHRYDMVWKATKI